MVEKTGRVSTMNSLVQYAPFVPYLAAFPLLRRMIAIETLAAGGRGTLPSPSSKGDPLPLPSRPVRRRSCSEEEDGDAARAHAAEGPLEEALKELPACILSGLLSFLPPRDLSMLCLGAGAQLKDVFAFVRLFIAETDGASLEQAARQLHLTVPCGPFEAVRMGLWSCRVLQALWLQGRLFPPFRGGRGGHVRASPWGGGLQEVHGGGLGVPPSPSAHFYSDFPTQGLVACGDYFSVAVGDCGGPGKRKGALYAWGKLPVDPREEREREKKGEGEGTAGGVFGLPRLLWKSVRLSERVESVACGGSHILFVSAGDGGERTVYGLGSNSKGQLGMGHFEPVETVTRIEGLEGVVRVACGAEHSLIVDAWGEISSFGDNGCGQLGVGQTLEAGLPFLSSYLQDKETQREREGGGKLGKNFWNESLEATADRLFLISFPPPPDILRADFSSLSLASPSPPSNSNSSRNPMGLEATSPSLSLLPPPSQSLPNLIPTGAEGLDTVGPPPTLLASSVPLKITRRPITKRDSGSSSHSRDGTGKSKDESFIRLGCMNLPLSSEALQRRNRRSTNSTTGARSSITPDIQSSSSSVSLSSARSVACGAWHCLAVSSSGQLFAWGKSKDGRLGLGRKLVPEPSSNVPPPSSSAPQTPFPLQGNTQGEETQTNRAAAGHSPAASPPPSPPSHSLPPSRDVWEPSMVPALQHVKLCQAAAGLAHSAGLSVSGEVFTWGLAEQGQLGHGGMESGPVYTERVQMEPKRVEMLSNVVSVKVVCGGYHTLVLSVDGQAFSFGTHDLGQLEKPYWWDRDVPAQLSLPPAPCPAPASLASSSSSSNAASSSAPPSASGEGGFAAAARACGGKRGVPAWSVVDAACGFLHSVVRVAAAGGGSEGSQVPSGRGGGGGGTELAATGRGHEGQLGTGKKRNAAQLQWVAAFPSSSSSASSNCQSDHEKNSSASSSHLSVPKQQQPTTSSSASGGVKELEGTGRREGAESSGFSRESEERGTHRDRKKTKQWIQSLRERDTHTQTE